MVDTDHVEATADKGVVTITVPKLPEAKTKGNVYHEQHNHRPVTQLFISVQRSSAISKATNTTKFELAFVPSASRLGASVASSMNSPK